MTGEHGIGPLPGRLARGVDVRRQAAPAAVHGVDRCRRVMAGDDDGALVRRSRRLQARQLAGEERHLLVTQRVLPTLRGDDPWAFEDVRVDADDRYKRSVEREVDARLVHRGAEDPAGVGRGTRRGGAEIGLKSG